MSSGVSYDARDLTWFVSYQILQLSGVGPASHLNSLGIPVLADLPGVGSHLKDHIVVNLGFMDKTQTSLSYFIPKGVRQSLRLIRAILQYKIARTGPLTTNVRRSRSSLALMSFDGHF